MSTDAQTIVDLCQELFPALTSVSDALLLPWATKAIANLDVTAFGDMYLYALCYATAHEYQLFKDAVTFGASASGPVQSKRAGNVGITFVGSSVSADSPAAYWSQTVYGRAFLALRKERAASHAFIVGPSGV